MRWLVKRVENRCCAPPEKCRRAGRVWGRGSEEGNGVTLCTVVQRCSSGSPHCTEGLPTGWELMGLALHTLFPRPHWSAHHLGSQFLARGGFLGSLSGGGDSWGPRQDENRCVPSEFRLACPFTFYVLNWLYSKGSDAKIKWVFLHFNVKKIQLTVPLLLQPTERSLTYSGVSSEHVQGWIDVSPQLFRPWLEVSCWWCLVLQACVLSLQTFSSWSKINDSCEEVFSWEFLQEQSELFNPSHTWLSAAVTHCVLASSSVVWLQSPRN